jgi:hypothetical protein
MIVICLYKCECYQNLEPCSEKIFYLERERGGEKERKIDRLSLVLAWNGWRDFLSRKKEREIKFRLG